MRKYLAIIEGRSIKKYNMDRISLPLTIIRSHLYRTEERLFHLERGGDQAIEFVELENTQVLGSGEPGSYLNPDDVIAVLDTAPSMKGKVANWNSLINGGGMNFIYFILGIIMAVYVIFGLVTGSLT